MRKILAGRRSRLKKPFQMKIDTTITDNYNDSQSTGTPSGADSFHFPIDDGTDLLGYTINFTIDWGDGSTSDVNSTNYATACAHQYTTGGVYIVSATGSIAGFSFYAMRYHIGESDGNKLIAIEQWGDLKLTGGPDTNGRMFANCENLTEVSADDIPYFPRTSSGGVNQYGAAYLFEMRAGLTSALTTINNIANWDVSNVAIMQRMFKGNKLLQYGTNAGGNIDLSAWDVSKVTDFNYMFYECSVFNPSGMFSNFGQDIGDVSLQGMFREATAFNFDIGDWDTSSVTSISVMFMSATAFNQDIGDWDTSSVLSMVSTFRDATAFNQDIGGWDVSSVLTFSRMFNGATAFNQYIGDWDTSSAVSIYAMFDGATAFDQDISTKPVSAGATTYDAWDVSSVTQMSYTFSGAIAFNQDIGDWDTSSVTDMEGMFQEATAFNQQIGQWDTSSVEDMSFMFNGAAAFNQDIKDWNTSLVLNMQYMFSNATAFNQYINERLVIFASPQYTAWDTGSVTNMSYMFNYATAFNQDIEDWDTSLVLNMEYMFHQAPAFNQDIGNWNTGLVTNMQHMFSNATAFNQGLDSWNTSSVTNMAYMFRNLPSFNQNLNSWNTSSVTNMTGMFVFATSFNGLIGNWDVSNVTNMFVMFSNAGDFDQDIGDWDTSLVESMASMFVKAKAFDQYIGDWNTSNVTNMRSMFNGVSAPTMAFNQNINTKTVTVGGVTYDAWDTSSVTDMRRIFTRCGYFDQDIGDWDVSKLDVSSDENVPEAWATTPFDDPDNFLLLSTANYDAILIDWAQLTFSDWPNGGIMNFGSSEYTAAPSAAATARASLINQGIIIYDGGST